MTWKIFWLFLIFLSGHPGFASSPRVNQNSEAPISTFLHFLFPIFDAFVSTFLNLMIDPAQWATYYIGFWVCQRTVHRMREAHGTGVVLFVSTTGCPIKVWVDVPNVGIFGRYPGHRWKALFVKHFNFMRLEQIAKTVTMTAPKNDYLFCNSKAA